MTKDNGNPLPPVKPEVDLAHQFWRVRLVHHRLKFIQASLDLNLGKNARSTDFGEMKLYIEHLDREVEHLGSIIKKVFGDSDEELKQKFREAGLEVRLSGKEA